MMKKEVIIDVQPTDVSIALLEDSKLVEFQKESIENSYAVGNIYVAKVAELKKSYKQASILTGQYFYLPIQTGNDWQITCFATGVESTLTSSKFEDYIRN